MRRAASDAPPCAAPPAAKRARLGEEVVLLSEDGEDSSPAPPSSSALAKPSASTACKPPPTSNAFALMMRRAEQRAEKHHFTLWLSHAGGLTACWAWGRSAPPPVSPLTSPVPPLSWSSPKPLSITFPQRLGLDGCSVVLHLHVEASLLPAFATTAGAAPPPPPAPPFPSAPGLSLSLLKSGMQKAVRRCDAYAATALAAEIWARSPLELLRRLLVIAVEDGVAHPALPLVAWLMLSSPPAPSGGGSGGSSGGGRTSSSSTTSNSSSNTSPLVAAVFASSAMRACVLRLVAEVAAQGAVKDAGAHELLEQASGAAAATEVPSLWGSSATAEDRSGGSASSAASSSSSSSLSSPSPAAAAATTALVASLAIRAAYGGMACDVDMLVAAAKAWARRFSCPHSARWSAALVALQPRPAVLSPVPSHGLVPRWQAPPHPGPALHSPALSPQQKLDALAWGLVPRSTSASTTTPAPGLVELFPPAGVDYHCSDVLDSLLSAADAGTTSSSASSSGASAQPLPQVVYTGLGEVHALVTGKAPPVPRTPEAPPYTPVWWVTLPPGERTSVHEALKTAMWWFRSGVNHRQTLSGHDSHVLEAVEAALRAGGTIALPPAEGFQRHLTTVPPDAAPLLKGWRALEGFVDAWSRRLLRARGGPK